jgi:hypothetical protein
MTSPIVFCGCEAYLCEVLGKQQVRLWLRDPADINVNFDKTRTIELDLSANPMDRPQAIEVDNHRTAQVLPGLTTIGPEWPRSKQDRGGVWISKAKFEGLPTGMTNRPSSTFSYQWEALLYLPEGTIPARRYNGFHAQLVHRTTTEAIFKVWNATDTLDAQSAKLVTLDPGNSSHVDAASSDNFTIVGQRGKLFIHWDKLSEYQGLLISPKLPLGEQDGPSFKGMSLVKAG